MLLKSGTETPALVEKIGLVWFMIYQNRFGLVKGDLSKPV